jgi:hypothetical protein
LHPLFALIDKKVGRMSPELVNFGGFPVPDTHSGHV